VRQDDDNTYSQCAEDNIKMTGIQTTETPELIGPYKPIIKLATLDDLELVDRFQIKMGETEKKFDDLMRQEGDIRYYPRKRLRRFLREDKETDKKKNRVLIAQYKDDIVRCGIGQIRKENIEFSTQSFIGYIGLIYVEQEFRKYGIGRNLVSGLNDWFSDHKIIDIRLDVYAANETAIGFYRMCGFRDYVFQMRKKG
jgi:ribosomal protein S18 acetylase RimI-like enzyme